MLRASLMKSLTASLEYLHATQIPLLLANNTIGVVVLSTTMVLKKSSNGGQITDSNVTEPNMVEINLQDGITLRSSSRIRMYADTDLLLHSHILLPWQAHLSYTVLLSS